MATTKLEPVLRPEGRWQCGFVTTCNRAVLQLNRNGADGGAAFLEASADGETFAPLTPPILAPDITVPVNLPKGFTVRVTSSSPITYAGVIADSAVAVVNPTQTYFPNAVSDYDGNWYDAVIIGNQVWLAENLRSKHYQDGTPIADGGSDKQSSTTPYYYDNTESSVPWTLRGFLYNWPAVMNGSEGTSGNDNPSGVQGIAPNGWHIPGQYEWIELLTYVGSVEKYIFDNDSRYIGKALAAKTCWKESDDPGTVGNDQSRNNATGFNGYVTGAFQNGFAWTMVNTFYWTTFNTAGSALIRGLIYTAKGLEAGLGREYYGFSVRCVCDMAPDAFRSWYVRTYNTNNHQVDNKYATD